MKHGMKLSLGAFAIGAVLTTACGSARRSFGDEEQAGPQEFTSADAGPAPEGGACLSEIVKAETVPLAMIVLLDRSGSMDGDKWTSATKAIRSFADRAEVVGMQMGVQFFPPLAGADECNASGYKNLAVPIAKLPDNVLAINQKLTSATVSGGTPMRAGLEGSIAAMQDFLAKSSPHEGVVILVTDGDPTSCGNVANVASVAASGANPPSGAQRVRTFAVGMAGATFSNLDQIAASGGGDPKAFDVSGANAGDALLAALDKVRMSAIGCELVLPLPPPEKGKLDLDSVEVKFNPGANDPEVRIRRVADASGCGGTTGGFYYDDPANPSRVVLCPASCQQVRGAPVEAKLDLVFGCIQGAN